MKKTVIALCMLILVSVLFACGKGSVEKPDETTEVTTALANFEVYFDAEIIKVADLSLLVKVIESGDSGILLGSEAWISSGKAAIDYSGFSAGETIKVFYDGVVMESYPLQINSVTSIGQIGVATEKTVVNIIDKTRNSDIATCDALEGFFSDDRYDYYYFSIRSEYVVVVYSDGSEETVKDALVKGIVTITDLDAYGIGYHKVPKNIQNIVYHSDRGGESDAEEVFYIANEYAYAFPSIRSDVVIVYYNDGTEKPIAEALQDGSVLIEDLDFFNIEYYKYPCKVN